MSNQSFLESMRLLEENYDDIRDFIHKYNQLSLIEFDYHVSNDFNLYSQYESFDFSILERNLDTLIAHLNVIRRISSHPIIRLKDEIETLPVESVFKITNQTFLHISNHSELWGDISNNMLIPKKLQTQINTDEYAIYENVGFVFLVYKILAYVRHNQRIIKDILYTNKFLNFDILERIHHTLYFQAIGKLQTGYLKNLDRNYSQSYRCLNKLNFIESTLKAHMTNTIFKRVKVPQKYVLKKTNIFMHHKDYKKIFNLLLHFLDAEDRMTLNLAEQKSDINYLLYVKTLFVFSLNHFNFKLKTKRINFNKLNLNFVFDGWQLNLKDVTAKYKKGILLTVKKNVQYRILILPYSNEPTDLSQFEKRFALNEIIYVSYLETGDNLYISKHNLNSFQRLQQIVLRAMIYSDTKKDICPFCGNPLAKEGKNKWVCYTCRNEITKLNCEEQDKIYYATTIKNFKMPEDISLKDEFLYTRYMEGIMYYRNITKLDKDLNPICPHCQKIHI